MTTHIDLNHEIEDGLAALAAASGLSLQQFEPTLTAAVQAQPRYRTPDQRAAAWIETARRFPEGTPLPDESMSRESIGKIYFTAKLL
jgi:hypothetical protein